LHKFTHTHPHIHTYTYMCIFIYIYAGEHSVQAVVPDETNQHLLLGTYTQPGDSSFLLTYWVMSPVNESYRTWECLTSHLCANRVTHLQSACWFFASLESCHMGTSHIAHVNELCPIRERIGSRIYSQSMDWCWRLTFRTNLVRCLSNKEMQFKNNGAVLVQIAPLWSSQPAIKISLLIPRFNWVMSHENESCCTRKWIMSHTWTNPVTHLHSTWWFLPPIESYWIMSHVNKSCRTRKWIMSQM